jgi:hypothetical protein
MFTMSLPSWARSSFACGAAGADAEGAAAGVDAGGAAGLTDSSRFHIAEILPLYWKIPIEGRQSHHLGSGPPSLKFSQYRYAFQTLSSPFIAVI